MLRESLFSCPRGHVIRDSSSHFENSLSNDFGARLRAEGVEFAVLNSQSRLLRAEFSVEKFQSGISTPEFLVWKMTVSEITVSKHCDQITESNHSVEQSMSYAESNNHFSLRRWNSRMFHPWLSNAVATIRVASPAWLSKERFEERLPQASVITVNVERLVFKK